jgi:cell wall-associated NlpC family hydrolase
MAKESRSAAQVGSVRTSTRRPIALLSVVAVALSLALLPGGGATAAPSPADAQRQLQSLGVKMDHINEQANTARVQLNRARTRKAGLARQMSASQAALDDARAQVGQIAQSAYRDGGMRLPSSLLKGAPGDFVDQMATLEWLSDQQRATLATAKLRQAQFDDAKKRVDLQVESAARLQKQVDGRKAELAAEMRKWEKIKRSVVVKKAPPKRPNRSDTGSTSSDTGSTKSDDDGTVTSTPSRTSGTTTVRAGGNAARVVQFALAQMGEPYVFGAAGPNSWDCSGLTEMAWAQAGVSLPHSAHLQYYQIQHVARANLRAGDLVFFYGLEHVGVYIGHNEVVHAPTPGDVVKVTNMNYMPFAGAGRP